MHTAAAISRCFERRRARMVLTVTIFVSPKIDKRHARALRQSDKGGSDW